MTIVLWQALFRVQDQLFNYNLGQIQSYIFLVLVVGSLIFSLLSANYVGAEISSGDLNYYLLKPYPYITYWFTRNLADKALNLLFSVVEITILYLILQPQIALTNSIIHLVAALFLILFGLTIYYFLHLLCEMVGFWAPENMWALSFLLIVSAEVLGGAIFPLDVLPASIIQALQFTPFPYLIYYPIQFLLGKTTFTQSILILSSSFAWVSVLYFCVQFVWYKGLKNYSAYGQ
ncbi:MAG: ABC transporter permease [Patescibacteria group bacterium]|nr:MAG: ABC transporter permease [Patescibacteria group bacterium]